MRGRCVAGARSRVPPNRATRADPMHPKRPSPNPVSRSCFGGIFQHAASLFLAGFGTASPPLQVDALRVADAPWFSKAETVIGSFAGRLQAVGRVRWHRGLVDPSCVSCRVELATWRLRAVRCLASVSNNNQIPNRPDESIPDSTPEGPCRCHQRTTTAFRSGCGQARRRRSSLPPIRMEPRSTALPPRGNLWRTEVQCMTDTVFCTECRIQSTASSDCEECGLQQRNTMACCRAFSFWRVSRNTDNPGFRRSARLHHRVSSTISPDTDSLMHPSSSAKPGGVLRPATPDSVRLPHRDRPPRPPS